MVPAIWNGNSLSREACQPFARANEMLVERCKAYFVRSMRLSEE
jgi:hypothetical protein